MRTAWPDAHRTRRDAPSTFIALAESTGFPGPDPAATSAPARTGYTDWRRMFAVRTPLRRARTARRYLAMVLAGALSIPLFVSPTLARPPARPPGQNHTPLV